jgi:mono/diheme cytochrome c family protein
MVKKIIFGLLGLILLLVIGFVVYGQLGYDKTYDIPFPDLQTSSDPDIIARGKYLVHGPAHCAGCHVSSFDDFIAVDAGQDLPLKGGVVFELGPLGAISPANLTPDKETGIGRYSDGQLFRMMRHAVKPNGQATLAVMMPFWNMADDDLVAVVSYLRSMEPVANEVMDPKWSFMGKIIKTYAPTFKPIMDPNPPKSAPPMSPTKERGEYLARYVANCVGCHTPRDPMTFEATGPEFSGGFEMEPFPKLHAKVGVDEDLWHRSQNITPASNGALARFQNLEAWIDRFRKGRIYKASPMDWGAFGKITDTYLDALYVYLNSLDPVENEVGPSTFKKTEEE